MAVATHAVTVNPFCASIKSKVSTYGIQIKIFCRKTVNCSVSTYYIAGISDKLEASERGIKISKFFLPKLWKKEKKLPLSPVADI